MGQLKDRNPWMHREDPVPLMELALNFIQSWNNTSILSSKSEHVPEDFRV